MIINSIDTSDVRHETLKGRDWLVAPITLIKSMNLSKGYVPESQVINSTRAWNGTPLTLNHPRNAQGQLVSANSPEMSEKTWLGHIFNAESRNEDTAYVDGEAWFDIEHCNNLGGEAKQIIENLESDTSVAVSSSYFGNDMPAGNYDGEYYEKVKGNLKPDHVAVLPNKRGRCSMEDGCGVGPIAANMIMTNSLTQARTPEFSGTETSSFTDVSKGLRLIVEGLGLDPDIPDDAENVRVSHLNDSERQAIADLSLLGDPDADDLYDLRLFQVVNHNNGNLNENALRAVIGGPGQRAEISDDTWRSAANKAIELLESEFDVEIDSDQVGNAVSDIDREPPQAARDNAQMALDAREETGNPNDCGRETGWRRANQLVNNDEMSWDAISRMAQFSRHESNKEQGDEGRENCGWMMWKAWGGDEGIAWAQRKMDEREQAANTDDPKGEDSVMANVISQARSPSYDGTETDSWSDVNRSLSAIADANDWDDVSSVDDLTDDQRMAIAEHSLLGDPDAESFSDLLFFPVVNPSTGALNEGALDAVLSGRGSQADIDDSTLESARSVAENLLEEEFDRDLSENSANIRDKIRELADAVGLTDSTPDTRGHIMIHDQTSDGSFVVIDEAVFRDSTWGVAIHEDDDGEPGDILGTSDVYQAQEQQDNIKIDADLENDGRIHAMLHFATSDELSEAITAKDGSVFMDTAFVGVAPDGVDVEESSHHEKETSYNGPADTGVHTNMERTQELVENHGFQEENLPPEDTECFDQIYNSITDDGGIDIQEEVEQAVNNAVDEIVDERVTEALSTNQEEQQKSQLADQIISNSNEWEEDDREELMDSPTSVLKDLASNQQTQTTDFRGQIGASANVADADANNMPSLSVNGHEGDD